jgi:uncharacterized protein YdeI (YjbR/CyaY-like superfamily)
MPRGPVYFESAAALRRWFARHAKTETELVVGYMKKGTGVPSVSWPESVDEALCVGWIDGVRKRIDDARYQIRFSPRKDLERIRANPAAWKYYRTLPPGYLRMCAWWIISAKRPETRSRRLQAFIARCAARVRFTW